MSTFWRKKWGGRWPAHARKMAALRAAGKVKRGNWVVQAVAGPSFVTPGIRHMRTGLYKGEAGILKKKWTKKYPDLGVEAVRWEPM